VWYGDWSSDVCSSDLVLGALTIRALAAGRWRRVRLRAVAMATLICALYGYSDEFHQRFVPGRQYDLWDMGADTVGGCAAAASIWVWGILSRGSRRPDEP
jgi:VanZ family protein